MAVVARVIGVSLLAAGLGAGFGFVIVGNGSDATGIALLLACVGSVVGALAGGAGEVVRAVGRKDLV